LFAYNSSYQLGVVMCFDVMGDMGLKADWSNL